MSTSEGRPMQSSSRKWSLTEWLYIQKVLFLGKSCRHRLYIPQRYVSHLILEACEIRCTLPQKKMVNYWQGL